jgi:putative transposase
VFYRDVGTPFKVAAFSQKPVRLRGETRPDYRATGMASSAPTGPRILPRLCCGTLDHHVRTPSFGLAGRAIHCHFRELLLHAAARESLFCPVYVVMPDHAHLVWMGMRLESDQRNAMKFLRKHLAAELARRSPTGVEFELQKQSHDSVLREKDRLRGAFQRTCFYVSDNPRRKELVKHPSQWPYLGAVVPGHPFLHPLAKEFWEQFWKLYEQRREPLPA